MLVAVKRLREIKCFALYGNNLKYVCYTLVFKLTIAYSVRRKCVVTYAVWKIKGSNPRRVFLRLPLRCMGLQ